MIIGEAHIIVRAITTGVERDIRRGFRNTNRLGDDVGRGIGRNIGNGIGSGLSSGGGMWAGLTAATDGARAQFDSLIRTAYTLGPAIAVLVGAVGALAGGFVALSATVAGSLPSLIALPGVLVAIAQGALTLKLAFQGVGEAIGAGLKNAGGGGGGAKKVEKDLTNFYRRIQDARENLARAFEDSNRQIYEAEERLAEAKENFSRIMADSDEKIADARLKYQLVVRNGLEDISDAQMRLLEVEERSARDIVKAKQKLAQAQVNLNNAFEEGREELQQLNFASEDAVINEKRAALALEKAREKLLRVQDLPPNDRIRREAELAFAQADLNYRKAMDTNSDMAKEQERLNKAGVDGTRAVSRAKESLADATQDLAETELDSVKDLEKARVDLARTQRDADEAAIKAKKNIAKAEEDKARREIDALDSIADAERNLEKVIIKRLEAEYDAELALKRAVEDLEKARKKGDATGAGGANAYRNALAKLSKEQRAFVEYMVNTFIPSIDKLRDAAAREFFPKLIPALEDIRTRLFPALIPLLEKTGGVLGDIAKDFAKNLTSDESIRQIQKIWDANDNVLKDLGKVAENALSGFLNVLEAAIPLVSRFSGWLVDISEDFRKLLDTDGERNAFTRFLEKSGNIAAKLGDLFSAVFGGFGNLVSSQIEPGTGGYRLLDYFITAAEKFREFTSVNTDRISEFFGNVANNSMAILSGLGDIIKEILKLGENPQIAETFVKLGKGLGPALKELGDTFIDAAPALMDFAKSFIDFGNATLDSGAIQVFWEVLTKIFDGLTKIFEVPWIQKATIAVATLAAAGVALRTAWMLLRIPILGIMEPLVKLINLLNKFNIIKTIIFNFRMAIALFGAGPVGLAIAAVAGLVAAFIAMWRESETFREAIKNLLSSVFNKLLEVFEKQKEKINNALEPLGGMEGAVDGLKKAFKFLGDILGTYVIPFLEISLLNALDVVMLVLGTVIDLIGGFIKTFANVFEKIGQGDIGGAVKELLYGIIIRPIEIVFSNLFDFVSSIMGNIVGVIERAFAGSIFADIVSGALGILQGLFDGIRDIWNNIINWIKEFLGISSPSKLFASIGQGIVDGLMSILTGIVEIATLPFRMLIAGIKLVFNTLLTFFTQGVQPAIDTFFNGLITIVNMVKDGIIGGFEKIKDGIITVINFLINTVLGSAENFFDGIINAAEALLTKIGEVFPGLKGIIDGVIKFLRTNIQPSVTNFFNTIRTGADALKTGVETAFNAIKGTVETVAGAVKRALSGLWGGLSAGLAAAVSTVRNLLRPAFNFIVGVTKELRKIPLVGNLVPDLQMPSWLAVGAEGGIVTRPTLALIGEAGPEAVIPLNKTPGSSPLPSGINAPGRDITINVYPSPGMDEVELASIVSREISFMMRRGAA